MNDQASPKRFQILMLISGLDIGRAHGGAERFGVELSRHLDKSLYAVTLCAYWRRGGQMEAEWVERLTSEGLEVIFASDWPGRFGMLAYLRGVQRLAARYAFQPADLVHSHYQMGTLAALILKAFNRTRFTLRTAHVSREWGDNLVSWACRQAFTNWVYPALLDREAGVSTAVVAALQRHPGARLTHKRPVLIHNAIYPEIFKSVPPPVDDTLNSLIKGKLVVGSIGRLTHQKGYSYLLKAVPLVLAQNPQAIFIIIGDGPLRMDLESQAEQLGIASQVLFLGQRQDVANILQSMDLFVLPSLYEGLPTVVLESMACGVPVVATAVPGTDELIQAGDNGWLVPARHPEALADAVIEALRRKDLRERYIRRARETTTAFRVESIAHEYEKLYKEVITGKLTTPS